MKQLLRAIPAVCVLCYHYHNNKYAICKQCEGLFIRIVHACSSCRLPLLDAHHLQCGQCIKNKPAFDNLYVAYSFEEPLRTLLHEFKYKKALYLRTLMTKLMLDAISFPYQPDCLLPVPLHPKRLRQRGFNQAAELAKLLAKQLNIPVNLHLCQKTINTVTQVSIAGKLRQRNLKNAFLVKPNSYRHVTLIDDLLTTGSTANELAITLKRQGIYQVDVWCLARTNLV